MGGVERGISPGNLAPQAAFFEMRAGTFAPPAPSRPCKWAHMPPALLAASGFAAARIALAALV